MTFGFCADKRENWYGAQCSGLWVLVCAKFFGVHIYIPKSPSHLCLDDTVWRQIFDTYVNTIRTC